ncbi:MAG: AAA family ATPase [Clostridia bacterium]|nr:AAA family ATPase [Clostridia bacterium]
MKYSSDIQKIIDAVPHSGDQPIDWDGLGKTKLKSVFEKMASTPQNPEYHSEGDVLTHTKLVCQRLVEQEEYSNASDRDRTALFIAGLLHDIGKIACTRLEDGKWVSPHHALTGGVMAREFLWKELGLCGTSEAQQLREEICALVKYHSFPPYAIDDAESERKMLKIASNGQLIKGFSVRKLCILERADALGRICEDSEEQLNKTECCLMLAEEMGCADTPYPFPSPFAQRSYMSSRSGSKDSAPFNPSYGQVILLSGLPGTGKDTWISRNCPQLPVISLDAIRAQLKVLPTDNQSPVIAEAHERARAFLRSKQSFVWNATNITSLLRSKQISLFEQYNASVKTVFLETDWSTQLKRNRSRKAEVPERVIEKMLSKLELPESFECETVTWETV